LQLSDFHDLDLDLESSHTVYYHVSLIDLYRHTKFCSVIKTVKGWTDIYTGFIWSTPAKKTE